jgi:hypothetical protein
LLGPGVGPYMRTQTANRPKPIAWPSCDVVVRGTSLVLVTWLAFACGISPLDSAPIRSSVQSDGHFTGQQMTATEAKGLIAKQASQVSPVLFPVYITDGLNTCIANGSKDTFFVTCFGGAISIEVATQTENPKEYKPILIRRLKFRNDPRATFMDANPKDVNAVRMLLWVEPGQSADIACNCVHYDLHSVGNTAIEFWKIANSLQVAISS